MKPTGKNRGSRNPQINVRATGWIERHPVALFLVSFAVLMTSFYVFLHSRLFNEYLFGRELSLNARLSSFFLNLLGQDTNPVGNNIVSPAASIVVGLGCDALEPMALFASAVISFPSPIRYKVRGVIMGISFLFAVNILRIVSLFLIQRYYPGSFEIIHGLVWQAVFIALAIGCFGFQVAGNKKK